MVMCYHMGKAISFPCYLELRSKMSSIYSHMLEHLFILPPKNLWYRYILIKYQEQPNKKNIFAINKTVSEN